jgi:hypothetical protein
MTVLIKPEELYFGGPTTMTYGGVDLGATLTAPKVTITPTIYTPEFQNAKGPLANTDIDQKVIVECDLEINQITGEKMAFALPGSTATVVGPITTITFTAGRIPSDAYKDLVLIGPGLDGRTLQVTIKRAINVGPAEVTFDNTKLGGSPVKFQGRGDPANPTVVPIEIVLQ